LSAVVGDIVTMAFPNTPGDGTPGTINLNLSAEEPFFLPLWNFLGNKYQDGSSDALIPINSPKWPGAKRAARAFASLASVKGGSG